jgi:hypothetical protein
MQNRIGGQLAEQQFHVIQVGAAYTHALQQTASGLPQSGDVFRTLRQVEGEAQESAFVIF